MPFDLNLIILSNKVVAELVLISGYGQLSEIDIKDQLIFKEFQNVCFWNILT
jgi:hypothetical protein